MITRESQLWADIAVEGVLPTGSNLTLTYASGSAVSVGQLVWVPVRKRVSLGCVIRVHSEQPDFETRDVLDVVPGHAVAPDDLDLAAWLARETAGSLFGCIALMLPPGVRHSVTPWFEANRPPVEARTRMQGEVLEQLRRNGRMSLEQLQTAVGSSLATVLPELERMSAVSRRYTSDVHTVQPRTETWWRLGENPSGKLTARQQDLYDIVARSGREGIRAAEARDRAAVSNAIASNLIDRGLILTEHRSYDPEIELEPVGTIPQLTDEQATAWDGLVSVLAGASTKPQLLFGVTGSGKTELYLRAIAHVLREGKQAIFLVPEIALTTHIVARVRERFPGQVALLHSGLAAGPRQEAWNSVATGERRIVVGTRSALLARVPRLGLIVIDEEHDTSYKQDADPRYDVRSLAEEVARRNGATVIYGSATPRIETLYRGETGSVDVYRLANRAVAAARELPPVQIVDSRAELHQGNVGLISRPLDSAIRTALERGEQSMLLLNRRGTSTIVICRNCGSAVTCPNCDIPLVFHKDRGALICHRCDHRERPVTRCPRCDGQLDYFGAGTQRVESEVRKIYPTARVLRWDQDTSRKRGANAEFLAAIERRDVDIIIGTQMIAKGLDLPYVTTVGIISADVGLHFPDFRSGERTFQLITQMAGRAGRRTPTSRVIVQTYSPNHYVLLAAQTHDVHQFYRHEIAFREQYRFPPFGRLVRYVIRADTDDECAIACDQMVRDIGRIARDHGVSIEIIGPAPAFAARVRGQYQWHMIVRAAPESIQQLLGHLPNPPGWVVDVDPVSLL